jgi:hypothetical protein
MSPGRSPRRIGLMAGVLVLLAGLPLGCSRAALDLVDLDFRRLPAEATLIRHESLPACYWWLEGGRIHVVAGRTQSWLAGPLGGKRIDFSLWLPGVPADRARTYRLGPRSLRGYLRQDASHARYRSIRGIAAVWLRPAQRLHVKLRVVASKEVFHVLTGWTAVGQTVLVGTFDARRNASTGQIIWQRSEADGMQRGSVANTGGARGRDGAGKPPPSSRPVQVFGPAVKSPPD